VPEAPSVSAPVSEKTEHVFVTGQEAKILFEQNAGAILLDVRNRDEYDEKHIEDSTLIPVDELASRLSELPDKSEIIIVYCRAGRRSGIAYGILNDNGYTNIYDMQTVDNWPDPLIKSGG
jgi:rhodanese-related sulfurtransferase